MITQRQRGFLNLYVILVSVLATALVRIYTWMLPFIPEVSILSSVNLVPYELAIFLGMISSGGTVLRVGRLHGLSWLEALLVASKQVLYVAGFVFALVFASKDIVMSRLFLATYLGLLLIFLTLCHELLPRCLAAFLFPDGNKIPTLLVGGELTGRKLKEWMAGREHLGMPLVGFLDDAPQVETGKIFGIQHLGGVKQLGEVLEKGIVKQVVLTDWRYEAEAVERMITQCEEHGCRFLIYNNYGESFGRSFVPITEGDKHFLALQVEPLESPFNRLLKRMLDICIALPVVVLVLPPLCLVVWVVQRVQSPGKLFYKKERGGMNMKEFKMLKFRSMGVAHENKDGEHRQAQQQDPRTYAFGRFLRRTSLDESPQFWNVLRGQMSVVGPRPHLLSHDVEFAKINQSYRLRSFVKPGLTGLAQVNGFRGEITDPEKLHRRVFWDLYYLTHWSLLMDVWVILKTVKCVLFPPKTAY